MALEFLQFSQIKRTNDNLVGYLSFKWNQEFQFTDLGIYKINGKNKIRIRYPDKARPKGLIYKEILEDVNSYILAQYPEVVK